MKPSPTMQQLIEQLAAKHNVDLSQPRATLRLTLSGRDDWLVVYTADGRHISLSRCVNAAGSVDTDPYILLLMDYPTGWLPLDLLYSPTEWEAFAHATTLAEDLDAVDLVELTEYWAGLFIAQGWLERSVKDETESR